MTDANSYTNWASYQLYDTSGSAEDWSYWNTGGYGFTFEIGDRGLPPDLRGRRRRRVPRPVAGRRRRPGRQPGGLLPVRERQPPLRLPLDHHRHRPARSHAHRPQAVHLADVPGHRRRRGPGHHLGAGDLPRRAQLVAGLPRGSVPLGGQPLHPAGGRGARRTAPPGAGAADRHAHQPRGGARGGRQRDHDVRDQGAAGLRQRPGHRRVGWPGRSGDEALDWDVFVLQLRRRGRLPGGVAGRPRGGGAHRPRAGGLHRRGQQLRRRLGGDGLDRRRDVRAAHAPAGDRRQGGVDPQLPAHRRPRPLTTGRW